MTDSLRTKVEASLHRVEDAMEGSAGSGHVLSYPESEEDAAVLAVEVRRLQAQVADLEMGMDLISGILKSADDI